jgi:hypothetical protein
MHPFKKSWLSQSVATFKSRRRASALALLVLVCACGGKSAAPTQPSTAQVSGAWRIAVLSQSFETGTRKCMILKTERCPSG